MNQQYPPKWADKFLEWYCSQEYIDEVQGDLYEWFQLRIRKQGLTKARLFYLFDVIRFMRSYRLKSTEELSQNSNNLDMLRNYIMISWRSLVKEKLFTFINLAGLIVGITAFLLLWTYVQNERSYDEHWENSENIYRVKTERYNQGVISTTWAAGAGAIGHVLDTNYAEVERYVIMTRSNAILEYNEKVLREGNTFYASEEFFNLFSVELLQGDRETALKEPYKMVLSSSTAEKYFGDEDPMGKIITHNGSREYEVTGVYADIPEKSHMSFDALYSFATFQDIMDNNISDQWNWDGFYNYIQLKEGINAEEFEAKIPDLIEREIGEDLVNSNQNVKFYLQPIEEIHLTSNFMMEMKPNGDLQSTNFLFAIAFFIIILAWVNYINLTTAKSMERAKEVGIRKVMGSQRGQLIRQFLVESLLLNLTSLLVSLLFIFILLPYFNGLAGRELTFDILDSGLLLVILSILIIGTFFSGLYPALVISGFKPVTILKGKLRNSYKGQVLRKGLVVFQFFTSLVLMVGTATVFFQLDYMKSQDLGVNIEQTLVVRGPNVTDSTYEDKLNIFKLNLSSQSGISMVTSSTAVPGSQPPWNAGGIYVLGDDSNTAKQYRIIGGDYDFLDTYEIALATGRKFDRSRTNDPSTVLLNESAVDLMGFKSLEESLAKEIFFWGDTFEIVGVVKDFHNESLKKSFEPLIFRLIPNASNFYSVKVNSTNMNRTIATVEEEWKAQFPGNPFDFFFLDDHYQEQYKADMQFGQVVGLFALLAIFIACLGLFGLASFITNQRTKEIGVRKVLGASLSSLMKLLSVDFLKLILMAMILAIPISWFLMGEWLSGFAYQMELNGWIFILPSIVLLAIALLTIASKIVRSGMVNPVDSLRQ